MFVASGSYELPFGPGKRFLHQGAVLGRVVGGWQITAYCRYTDGSALAITGGNGISALGYPNIRANYVGGDPYKVTNPRDFDPNRDLYLNSAAFATPSTFALGNTARVVDWVRGFSRKERIALGRQADSHKGARPRRGTRRCHQPVQPRALEQSHHKHHELQFRQSDRCVRRAGDSAQRHGGVLTRMNRREFAKGLGAVLVVSQLATRQRPRRQTTGATPTLYYVDGYHGGSRGHMPAGSWRDILNAMRAIPEWKISLDIEPASWDDLRREDPQAYRELRKLLNDPP